MKSSGGSARIFGKKTHATGHHRRRLRRQQEINSVWIYLPKAERAAALASADPERVTDL
jgi:hypothetical protein